MQLLDGKIVSQSIKNELQQKIAKHNYKAHLAAILVGDDGASITYVNSKVKSCEAVGIKSTLIKLDTTISENELIEIIEKLNADKNINGILVQLPLPKHISEQKIILTINPAKDVDGFHPMNIGKMVQGIPTFIPATPLGILLLLKHYDISVRGKHAVMIGRSNIVGTPMSILLSRNSEYGNATVTLCHSHSKSIKELCLQADIIITALGKPGFLKEDFVNDNAIVIDVGITRVSDNSKQNGYRLMGDVDFENVAPKTSYITPVPGGVGLMTIAALLTNTIKAYEMQNSINS